MRTAVLGSPDSWYLRDLQRAAAATGDELTAVPFDGLSASLGQGECDGETISAGGFDLRTFDAVLVRTMAPGSLEQVVFRMDALARLEALGVAVVNPPKAVEAAVDKYLTSARLQAAGLTTPRTIVCQSAAEALLAFEALGRDVVVKPIFGSEGRGIARLQDEAMAERAFRLLEGLNSVIYLQEFIHHDGFDLRLFVVGGRVLGMRRRNPHDWRTNCSRGAVAEPLELTDELVEQARRAAEAVGASLAGVDLLPLRDGRLAAIEVNAVPGWKALAQALDVDVARLVLEHVREQVGVRRAAVGCRA
ncbi:MAG: RimK family alpha-L-glutamate ligase [Planctomycetia bacterium]|nr:RimK family alpha-L-glutamate ligase [Planctomycetia bacterium]